MAPSMFIKFVIDLNKRKIDLVSIKFKKFKPLFFMMISSVKIKKQRIFKPYLGGWRHKITRVKYVNATSQTGPLSKQESWKNMCSRAVQCVQTNDRATQSLCHRATQMWR